MSVPNPELREPTTAEKLATYDAGMRERARIAGAPILRAHTFWGQSAPLGENTLIFTAPKGQLTVSDFEGTYVRPVTNRDVAMIGGVVDSDAKYPAHYRAVCDEPATAALVVAKLQKARGTSDEADRAWRRMEWMRNQPGAVHFLSVTDALSWSFWLPTGLNENRLTDWMKACGVSGMSRRDAMVKLMTSLRRNSNTQYTDSLLRLEAGALRARNWAGLSASASAFQLAERHLGCFKGIEATDPGLVVRNEIAGTTIPMRAIKSTKAHATLEVELDVPINLKVGSKVAVIDPQAMSSDNVVLTKLVLSPDGKHMHAAIEQAAGAGSRYYANMPVLGRDVWLTEAPFLMFPRRKTGRWLGRSGAPFGPATVREMPLEIRVAGQPKTA